MAFCQSELLLLWATMTLRGRTLRRMRRIWQHGHRCSLTSDILDGQKIPRLLVGQTWCSHHRLIKLSSYEMGGGGGGGVDHYGWKCENPACVTGLRAEALLVNGAGKCPVHWHLYCAFQVQCIQVRMAAVHCMAHHNVFKGSC